MSVATESTSPAAPTPRPARSGASGVRHIPALDGLRGAAVAAVLLFHADLLTGGWLGVDLFFVLSGFLITTLLLGEVGETGRVDLRAFWGRRARRLMPALLLALLGVALYAAVIARPVDLGQIRADGLATLLYVANWHTIWRGSNYWDIALAPSPLQHTWSLAIEEQFYVLWPVVVAAVVRRGSRPTMARRLRRFCLAGAALSTALFVGLYAAGASATRVYEGTDTRAVALLLGAAFAAYRVERLRSGRALTPMHTEAAGVAALVLLAVAWALLDGQSSLVYRGALPACSLLAAVVLAAAVDVRSPVVGSIFSLAPLRWLGQISYGLYLWHWPIYLVLSPNRTDLDGWTLFGVRFAASVAVALASYALLEQPIRRQLWRFRRPVVTLLAAMAVVAAVLVVATAGAVDPVQIKESDVLRRAAVTVPGAPRLLYVGDSVAASLAQPVMDDPRGYAVNPANDAVIGCSPLNEGGHRARGRAGDILEAVPCGASFEASVAGFQPDVVVAIFGAPPVDELELDGEFRRACDPEYEAEMDRRYRDMVDVLDAGGATVVLATVASSSNPWRDPDEARFVGCANGVIRKIAEDEDSVVLMDLDAHVCPNGPCAIGEDPQIRADGLHFTGPRGPEVARWVVEQALDAVS